MPDHREGGCFCGVVRYRLDGEPVDAGYCHCRMCRRSAGAPVLAWGIWPAAAFHQLAREPAVLRSSARGERGFCGRCGTHLLFRDPEEPEFVEANLATLDDPATVRPERHIWTASRIPWFELADDLPRYPNGPPVEQRGGATQVDRSKGS